MPDVLPDWVSKLEPLTKFVTTLSNIGRDPVAWFRRRASRFILGGIVGFVLNLAGIIRGAWETVASTFAGAANTLWSTVGSVVVSRVGLVGEFNAWVFDLALGSSLGPFEPVVIGMLFLVEFAVLVRLLRPGLLAVGEAASSVPGGGVITAVVTFTVETSDTFFGGLSRVVRGRA